MKVQDITLAENGACCISTAGPTSHPALSFPKVNFFRACAGLFRVLSLGKRANKSVLVCLTSSSKQLYIVCSLYDTTIYCVPFSQNRAFFGLQKFSFHFAVTLELTIYQPAQWLAIYQPQVGAEVISSNAPDIDVGTTLEAFPKFKTHPKSDCQKCCTRI